MARNYAALPHEYLEEMAELDDAEFGRLARALLKYSATGERPALAGNLRHYARRVFMQEDRFQEHYEELAGKRSEAGRKGALRRWGTTEDGKNGKAILPLANDGNTETKTKTKTKQSSHAPRSTDRRSGAAAGAAQSERMRRDMEGIAQAVRGYENHE